MKAMGFFFHIIAMFVILVTANYNNAWAQERESCEPAFWDIIKARATMQAQRETELAEVLIVKPDSVLEYSCFSREVRRMASNPNAYFSHNTSPRFFNNPVIEFKPGGQFRPRDRYQPGRDGNKAIRSKYGPKPQVESKQGEGIEDFSHPPDPKDNREKYPGQKHFDRNISKTQLGQRGNMVMKSLIEYINGPETGVDSQGKPSDGQFGHSPYGGHMGEYTACDIMFRVWHYSKCKDFDKNLFYTFSELQGNDPRKLPKPCIVPTRGRTWGNLIQASQPRINQPGGIQANGDGTGTDYSEKLSNPQCNQSHKFQTGVQYRVSPSSKQFKPEGVCVKPGCTYKDGRCS